jgi:hypothetical protein
MEDKLVVGGSLLVCDGELIIVSNIGLLQVVDCQSYKVLKW